MFFSIFVKSCEIFLGQIFSLHVWKQEKNFYGRIFFQDYFSLLKMFFFHMKNMQSQMFCGRILNFFDFCVNYETNEKVFS